MYQTKYPNGSHKEIDATNALYIGHGRKNYSWGVMSAVFAVFAVVVIIIAYCEEAWIGVRPIVLAVAIPIVCVGIILTVTIEIVEARILKRIFFVVYSDCLMILPTHKSTIKMPDYVKLDYQNIVNYKMNYAYRPDGDDSCGYNHLSDRQNCGTAEFNVKSDDGTIRTYTTQISDIEKAKEWLQKFVACQSCNL